MRNSFPETGVGRTLSGRRIVVTRAAEQATEQVTRLKAFGAEVLIQPTIKIVAPEDLGPMDDAVARLQTYDWVVFTSSNAVWALKERLEAGGSSLEALKSVKLAAVGRSTERTLRDLGLDVDLTPQEMKAAGLVEAFRGKEISGRNILFPQAKEGRKELLEGLRELGANVHRVVAYETVPDEPVEDVLAAIDRGVDAVTFTSPSTVRNLMEMLESARISAARVQGFCIGTVTAGAAERLGVRVLGVAEKATIKDLVDAVVTYFRS